jgi:hypothetical protein
MEAGWMAVALGACALEQSERERSEGEQMGEGGRRLGLHNCANPRRRVNGAWRPCVGPSVLPLTVALNEETEKRDEMEPERILVWWVKYVDTMRPCRVRCLDGHLPWSIIVPISIEKEKTIRTP